MRVRLAVAELVNSVFVNGQANVASSVHRISMDILFTTFCKLPLIHSEPLPRSRSKKKNTILYKAPLYLMTRLLMVSDWSIFHSAQSKSKYCRDFNIARIMLIYASLSRWSGPLRRTPLSMYLKSAFKRISCKTKLAVA